MNAKRPHAPMQILVTGGAGYLGSILVPQLLARGHGVRVLDTFAFRDASLAASQNHACELIRGDIRSTPDLSNALRGCNAVVHLAGIVGDPACDANPQLASEVNLDATRTLIHLAAKSGVARFVFASSCSVYGASDSTLDETSSLNPLSIYAQAKIDSEQFLLSARSATFAPVILRFGTLFGLSPAMRFDLVVNLLVARAAATGRITLFNEDQWRPFLHVEDAARAVLACLDAASSIVSGQIFNAGSPDLNLRIRDVGDAVQRLIPGTMVDRFENHADRRNYRVSFGKIQRALGFSPGRTLDSGIAEMYASILPELAADSAAKWFEKRASPAIVSCSPQTLLRTARRLAASR